MSTKKCTLLVCNNSLPAILLLMAFAQLIVSKLSINKNGLMDLSAKSKKQEVSLKVDLAQLSGAISAEQISHATESANEHNFKSKFLRAVFEKNENADFKSFSDIERNCILVRKYMKSMPFNIDQFDDVFFYTKIRDRFKAISYRNLAMNLLQNQTLFSEETSQLILSQIDQVRSLKLELRSLVDEENEDFEILTSTKFEIIKKAKAFREDMEDALNIKAADIANLSKLLVKTKGEVTTLAQTIVSSFQYSDALIATLKLLNNVNMLFGTCMDPSCMHMIYTTLIEETQLQGLSEQILSLLDPINMLEKLKLLKRTLRHELNLTRLELKEQLFSDQVDGNNPHSLSKKTSTASIKVSKEEIDKALEKKSTEIVNKQNFGLKAALVMGPTGDFVEPSKGANLPREQAKVEFLKDIITEVKQQIVKITEVIHSKKHIFRELLKSIRSDLESKIMTSNYKKYLKKVKSMKDITQIIYEGNRDCFIREKEIGNLTFLIEQMEADEDLDIVMSSDLLEDVETQLTRLTGMSSSITDIQQEIQKPEFSEMFDELSEILESVARIKFKNRDELLEALTRKRDLINRIHEIEEALDEHLARLFSGVQIVSSTSRVDGQTYRNMTYCFTEIDMGRLMFMMAKTNIVLNYETFMTTFLEHLNFAEMRNFVLLNYAVFVDKGYLKIMSNQYKIRKSLPIEEESFRQKLILEYVNRFSFLIEIYRRKVDDMKVFYNGNFFQRQVMFVFNGIFDVKDKILARIDDELDIEKIINKVLDYLISMIPFIESVPFLRKIIDLVVPMIVKLVLEKINDLVQVHKAKLKLIMSKCINSLKTIVFSQELEMLYYKDIFDRYEWVFYSMSDMKRTNGDFDKSVYQIRPDFSRESSKSVFETPDIHKIEARYKEITNKNDDQTNVYFMFNYSKNVRLFDDRGYLLSWYRMMSNNDLYLKLREKYNVYSVEQIQAVGYRRLV